MEQVEDGFNIVMEEVGDILLRLKSDDEVSERVEQLACYFRQDALLHKFNAVQAVTGRQKKPRRKYQQLNARVQTLINSYDENKENIIPFLRSFAHLQ